MLYQLVSQIILRTPQKCLQCIVLLYCIHRVQSYGLFDACKVYTFVPFLSLICTFCAVESGLDSDLGIKKKNYHRLSLVLGVNLFQRFSFVSGVNLFHSHSFVLGVNLYHILSLVLGVNLFHSPSLALGMNLLHSIRLALRVKLFHLP